MTPHGSHISGERYDTADFADDANTRYIETDAEVLASLGRKECWFCKGRGEFPAFPELGLQAGSCGECGGAGSIRVRQPAA